MKMSINLSNTKLGIIGGGQLGKMLNLAAHNWHLDTYVIDPNPYCSCSTSSIQLTEGDFMDYQTVYNFGRDKDFLTIEIEKINVNALKALEKEGVKVFPEPRVIELIQDKGLQKEFYKEKQLASSKFILLNGKESVLENIKNGAIHIPFVQKSRKGGYDGKGVHVVNDIQDLEGLMDCPCVIEDLVDIEKEDLVGFTPSSEYEFIVGGERLYRVQTNEISIKYERQGNEKEYNPSWAKSG